MKRGVTALLLFFLLTGCGGGGTTNPQFLAGNASNVLAVSVSSGSVCSGAPNIPCVQVTLCQPGTNNCQTIPDILVDTGSSGLRIFKSVLAPTLLNGLPTVTDQQGNFLAECLPFADLSAEWGAVRLADVILGNERTVTAVPIQVIDPNFGGASAGQNACGNGIKLLSAPADAASNGILGVDLFQYDMGNYFYCSPTTCPALTLNGLPPAPVQNPVFLLPVDHNGIILTFPDIPASGAPSLTGSLTLGIGTHSNNQMTGNLSIYPYLPANATIFALTTSYKGTLYPQSYIDSGTNGFVFPDPSIPLCTPTVFFCPSSTQGLVALNQDVNGNLKPVSFQIAGANYLFSTGNLIFNNLGFLSGSSTRFIWGFPFFPGKTIYFAYDLSPTPLGTGPFWAY